MLLLKLFFSFIQVGLFSVGGGYAAIPLIQEQIVNIHHLMTMEEFSDLITVAEMTPHLLQLFRLRKCPDLTQRLILLYRPLIRIHL